MHCCDVYIYAIMHQIQIFCMHINSLLCTVVMHTVVNLNTHSMQQNNKLKELPKNKEKAVFSCFHKRISFGVALTIKISFFDNISDQNDFSYILLTDYFVLFKKVVV